MDAKRLKAANVWQERVVAQQASGQAVRAWRRANGCPEHGFYWWRAKLGLSPSVGGEGAAAQVRPGRVGRATGDQ